MPSDYSRIHRLLKILTLIQSDRTWTAERLAGACGVNVRTIYRDMKTLEGAGVPYFYDTETHGYQVRRDFFMPPVELTLNEALALCALGEHVAEKEQIPLTRAAGRAVAKVRSQLPVPLRDRVAALDEHLTIQLPPAGPHYGIEDVYETVRAGIHKGCVLRCRYESIERSKRGEGSEEEFDFEPYALLFSHRAWYVIGHHGGRGEIRCMKLNRFASLAPTHRRYRVPKSFTLDDHLGNAWRMIRGRRRYDVELVFDADFAETIADTHWHRTQEIDWGEDGACVFRCTVDGLDEIVWWILSMGPHCVVRKPAALVDRVRKLAEQTAANYGSEVAR